MAKENWNGKENRKEKAISHTSEMQEKYSEEIKNAFFGSRIYPEKYLKTEITYSPKNNKTKVEVINNYIVEALLSIPGTSTEYTTVLNFASYKNPGGMFMEGAMAQEEALCHDSFLYNVLSQKFFRENFYEPNQKKLNRALYNDNLIYTPDVLFEKDECWKYINVITCAAPNANAAKQYCNVSDDEIETVMYNRIKAVLRVAYENNTTALYLGAFGCGVFGNSAETVAKIFKKLLTTEFANVFEYIAFVIPDAPDKNYLTFKSVFADMIS